MPSRLTCVSRALVVLSSIFPVLFNRSVGYRPVRCRQRRWVVATWDWKRARGQTDKDSAHRDASNKMNGSSFLNISNRKILNNELKGRVGELFCQQGPLNTATRNVSPVCAHHTLQTRLCARQRFLREAPPSESRKASTF
jgi:hypothetical protein